MRRSLNLSHTPHPHFAIQHHLLHTQNKHEDDHTTHRPTDLTNSTQASVGSLPSSVGSGDSYIPPTGAESAVMGLAAANVAGAAAVELVQAALLMEKVGLLGMRNWTKRFAVLTNEPRLSLFMNMSVFAAGGKPLESHVLRTPILLMNTKQARKGKYAFRINHSRDYANEEKLVLAFASKEQAEECVRAFESVVTGSTFSEVFMDAQQQGLRATV